MPEPQNESLTKRQEIVGKTLDRTDQKEDQKFNNLALGQIQSKESELKKFINDNEANKDKRDAFYKAVATTAEEYKITSPQILAWVFEKEIQQDTAILMKGDGKFTFGDIKSNKEAAFDKVKAIKRILTCMGFDPENLIDQSEQFYGGPNGKVKKFGTEGVDKESSTRLAVRQFQDFLNSQIKENNLEGKVKQLRVDGLFGNRTYEAMEAFLESVKVTEQQAKPVPVDKKPEEIAQEEFAKLKLSNGDGISVEPLEVKGNKILAEIRYNKGESITSGRFLISKNKIESVDPNTKNIPFTIEKNTIIYKTEEAKIKQEIIAQVSTPEQIFQNYSLKLGTGVSVSELSVGADKKLKGKLSYKDTKDNSVVTVQNFIFPDHLENVSGIPLVFTIRDKTIVYALGGSNEAAPNASLNAPSTNQPLAGTPEPLPIQQNPEIVEKVKSAWINASKNPQQLQTEIPELFKKDGQGQITRNIIESEEADANYRLISRDGNKVIVEFDNNRNNIPEGYDTIINGQFRSSVKYEKYDYALEAVTRGDILTNKEKNILATEYKNYYAADNITEQQLSRDYNFYENNPVMKRANELYADFDAIRENVDFTMDLSKGLNTQYYLDQLAESNQKLNGISENSPWKNDESFLKSLSGYAGRKVFFEKNKIQTFRDFIAYRDQMITQALQKIRDEEQPAQDIQPIETGWSDQNNITQFNQLSNKNSVEKDRYYRLVEEKNNQSIIEFSKFKNKVPDGYVIVEDGKIQKNESYGNYHIALQTAEKYNILTPEEKNLLETRYSSYKKAEPDYRFYINNPAVEHAYTEWQSYQKIIETLFALDDFENKNGTTENLRAKAKDKLSLLTTIKSDSVWQNPNLFEEIQQKEIRIIPTRYLKDKEISSLPELVKYGSKLIEPQAEKPNTLAEQNDLPPGLVPQIRNIEQIRDRANQFSNQTELIQWDINRDVFVIDFINLKEQGVAMNRLAAFIEKKDAPKDRVLNDRELQEYIRSHNNDNPDVFYVGHDYKADDLVRFFNTAERNQIKLNPQEILLRQTLIRNGFMKEENNGVKVVEPVKALVTFPENQNDNPQTQENEKIDQDFRELVLNHELSHGVLFTSKEYADYCTIFWNTMSRDIKTFFRTFLQDQDYDPTNEYLVINEMQAYLLTWNWEKQNNIGTDLQNKILNSKKDFLKNLPPNLREKIPHIDFSSSEEVTPSGTIAPPEIFPKIDATLGDAIKKEIKKENIINLQDGSQKTAASGRLYRREGNKIFYNSKPEEKDNWGEISDNTKDYCRFNNTFIEVKTMPVSNSLWGDILESIDGQHIFNKKGTLLRKLENNVIEIPVIEIPVIDKKSNFIKKEEGKYVECTREGVSIVKKEEEISSALTKNNLNLVTNNFYTRKITDNEADVVLDNIRFYINNGTFTIKAENTEYADIGTFLTTVQEQYDIRIKYTKLMREYQSENDLEKKYYLGIELWNNYNNLMSKIRPGKVQSDLANCIVWPVVDMHQNNKPSNIPLQTVEAYLRYLDKNDYNQLDTLGRFYYQAYIQEDNSADKSRYKEQAQRYLEESIKKANEDTGSNQDQQNKKKISEENRQLLQQLEGSGSPPAPSLTKKIDCQSPPHQRTAASIETTSKISPRNRSSPHSTKPQPT